MFCRNCGNTMDPNAAVCIKCGCMKGTGRSFCYNCGNTVVPNAAVCVNCGVILEPEQNNSLPAVGDKSKVTAGLLALFLGSFGIHNFYLGYTTKAIIQVLMSTVGWLLIIPPAAASIWAFVEMIMIFMGKIDTDGKGMKLKD